MFQYAEFQSELKIDNPGYDLDSRWGELSGVSQLVRLGFGTFTTDQLAAEMKKVPVAKWKKYKQTKTYLLREYPRLSDLLRVRLVDFRTLSFTQGGAGAIVHVVAWQSDSGNLEDLSRIRVRDRVSWHAPALSVLPFLTGKYRGSGMQYGTGDMAYAQGNRGRGNNTHAALETFSREVTKLTGPSVVEFVIEQTFEHSDDAGRIWTPIPHSSYSIHYLAKRAGSKVRLTITKSNSAKQNDSLANTIEI